MLLFARTPGYNSMYLFGGTDFESAITRPRTVGLSSSAAVNVARAFSRIFGGAHQVFWNAHSGFPQCLPFN